MRLVLEETFVSELGRKGRFRSVPEQWSVQDISYLTVMKVRK